VEECGPCPVFTSFTLAFALQLREKHGKTSQGKKNLSQGSEMFQTNVLRENQNPFCVHNSPPPPPENWDIYEIGKIW